MNARELYQPGQLTEAVAAAIEDVKQNPHDAARRSFLCELLCFAGDLERGRQAARGDRPAAPRPTVGIALLPAADPRREGPAAVLPADGRVPEFIDGPPRCAAEAVRGVDPAARRRTTPRPRSLLAEAEEARPRCRARATATRFDDLRDLDDLTAAFFEVLTSTGKYSGSRSSRWNRSSSTLPRGRSICCGGRADMIVRGGPDGEVYLPTLYAGTRVGRRTIGCAWAARTDWTGAEIGRGCGASGQRTYPRRR